MTGVRILRLATGHRVAAGLDWRAVPRGVQALAPGTPAGPVVSGPAGFLIRHGSRAAQAGADIPAEGAGSLLLAVARSLAAAAGPGAAGAGIWFAAANLASHGGGFWLGSFVVSAADGSAKASSRRAFQPAPSPEESCGGQREFLEALAEHAAVTAMAGVAVADLGDGLHEALAAETRDSIGAAAVRLRDRAPPPVLCVAPAVDGGPFFARRRRVPVPALALGAGCMAAALAGALVLPGIVSGWMARPLPPPPGTVAAEIPPGAFAGACTVALDGWWPRIVGWVTAERGCALAGHLPASLAGTGLASAADLAAARTTLTAWVKLTHAGSANGVLAATAARRVLAGWNHGHRRSGAQLLLWQTRDMELRPATGPSGGRQPAREPPGASLAALWANRPTAVVARQGGFHVSAPGGAEELLARAAQVDALEPVRLELPAGGVPTLVLRHRSQRQVPEDLFAGQEEKP